MTSMELLNILNAIRDSYILEARAMGSKKKTKMVPPGSGSPAEKTLPLPSEKSLGRYQAKEPRKRKKNGLKRLLVLSAAAGILLAVLAGRGIIAGWGDYFEIFRNRTENPYQYTQPTETAQANTETTTTQTEPNDLESARENRLNQDNVLFDAIFVPMAESQVEPNFDALKVAVSEKGFSWLDEAGVTLIRDQSNPDSYIRAEPSYETGSKQIGKLVYATLLGEEERQVSVTNLVGEEPNFYIDVNQFGEGTPVSSLEEIREYLNSEPAPANDNEEDSDSTPGVVDNLFVPIADSIIGKDAASIKLVLEDLGYNYYNGETYFYIYDPANPDHYLYGSPFLLADTDEIDILGVCVSTPKGDVSAEIFYFKDPIEYYIDATKLDSRTQVESLKEIKDYLNQR